MSERLHRIESRGGREELRAGLLRAPLLRLRHAQGAGAVTEVLMAASLNQAELNHDSSWVSLTVARRLLDAIIDRLGEGAVSSRGEFANSAEVLGMSVGMLRRVQKPMEAYRYLAQNSSEHFRVGAYKLEDTGEHHTLVRYLPHSDMDGDQSPRCLCLLRQAELRSLPTLWGLPEARLTERACLSQGDEHCVYELDWAPLAPRYSSALGLAGACLGAAASLPWSPWRGNSLASLFSWETGILLSSGSLAYGLGQLLARYKQDQASRSLERHRIRALEHGLEQHGHLGALSADLTHSVIGGKYRILRTVGSGGIGTIYAAEHLGLGFQVAVKVLRGAAAIDAAEVARLRREARVQMSLEHPNVVRTFDLDQMPDGSLYVVMELLQGLSLHEQLKRRRPLPAGLAIPVFVQASRALSAAHRLGIVHRDLKPANIFLSEGGTVKVLDFGMSKLAEEETLTQEGYTLGTPEYMSPEQCVGGAVDARSDLYAFGVLMYEALSGELPLRGRNRATLLEHHQRTIPRPLASAFPELHLPQGLSDLVMACLQKRPEDRPASAAELERRLLALPGQEIPKDYPWMGAPLGLPAASPPAEELDPKDTDPDIRLRYP